MCSEFGGKYIGHFTPKGNDAKSIADGTHKFLIKNDLANSLLFSGCDSTAINTGYRGGAMHFVEGQLGQRLVWVACQLHTIELPLWHVIADIDGPTTGTNSVAGPLGKLFSDDVHK